MPYDPNTDWQRLGNPLGQAGQKAAWWDPGGQLLEDPGAAAEQQRKTLLYGQAGNAGGFADQSQQRFGQLGQQGQENISALQGYARGQNSVSAEQARQSLAQLYGQQASMAASAAPRNSAMASRLAARNMMFSGQGIAGQQAIAGLQERQQAQNALTNAIMQQRQQELQATLGSRGQAIQGYGAQDSGAPEKSNLEKYGAGIGALFASLASDRRLKTDIQPGDAAANRVMEALSRRAGGMTMSDRALKTAIKPGGDKANDAIDGLRPYTYTYKDQALGAGPQVGVMAQDLQKAGLGQAVIRTPIGLAIDPGKLSGANTAMIAALGRRVAELEGNGAAAPDSPAAKRADVLASNERGDPGAVRSQEALDHRRALLQEIDLRRAGAYPGGDRPIGDLAGTSAQNEMDRRRAMMEALARSAQIAQAGR